MSTEGTELPGGQNRRQVGDLPGLIAAAHELKSPLSLVRQLALMLERGGLTDSERERILHQISLTSEQALRLTTNLTRASQLQTMLFDLEPVNPRQLCDDVAHELSPLFLAHEKTIRVVGRSRYITAIANQDLLKRIVSNFSDNALHYAGVNSKVELSTQVLKSGRTVRIGVRDYGPALPGDVWRRINKAGQTKISPLHARPESSGLGIYLAGQFAQAMNGSIGVIRHRDGATFYVDMHASSQLSLL